MIAAVSDVVALVSLGLSFAAALLAAAAVYLSNRRARIVLSPGPDAPTIAASGPDYANLVLALPASNIGSRGGILLSAETDRAEGVVTFEGGRARFMNTVTPLMALPSGDVQIVTVDVLARVSDAGALRSECDRRSDAQAVLTVRYRFRRGGPFRPEVRSSLEIEVPLASIAARTDSAR